MPTLLGTDYFILYVIVAKEFFLLFSGSTYEDLRVDQSQSLTQALHGRSSAEPNVYADLQEWLAPPSSATPSTQPTAESVTSAGIIYRG